MNDNSLRELSEMSPAKYINPYTDFGFKKLFGTPLNKELLISLLNSLFLGKEVISDLTYLNGENLGNSYGDRRAIFDVYCENEKGETFIVEMQKAEQQYFKDRSVFYSTFAIQNQGKKGIWDFNLKGVYTVGILDFVFPDNEYPEDGMRHEIQLMDVEDKHVFYNKLTFLYLEMPKFKKTEDELVTMYDKWLFVLHNLSRLMKRPAALQERIFTRLFEQAEIAHYSPKERQDYEDSLKVYRDLKNVLDTAELKGLKRGLSQGREEGLSQGREEGRKEGLMNVAKSLKTMGMTVEQIIKATGLTEEEILKL
jgi:predicted transposase/invertase (TIGR01784 family)